MIEHGHISDDVFNELGFGMDADATGREVVRNAGIGQEWLQRAKCLTHAFQCDLRRAHIESIVAAKRQKLDLEIEKQSLRIQAAESAVEKLFRLMEDRNIYNEDRSLENCPIEIIAELSRDALGEFILSRDPAVNRKCDIPKNKGSLEVALNLLESRDDDAPRALTDPRILWVYKCRSNPVKAEWKSDESAPALNTAVEGESDEANPDNSDVIEMVLGDGARNGAVPSELLSSRLWVATICRLFNVDQPPIDVSDETKDRADMLVKILRGRMQSFMDRRKVSQSRRNHWAIKLAYKNLSFVAAYMVLAGHVKKDLSCLDETQSLFSPDTSNFIQLTETFEAHEGAYLYYDANNGEFIRSGKVCGRGFKKRHGEHMKKASVAVNPESDFYLWFPTSDCVRAKSRSKRGLFDELTLYIAAGFNKTCEEALMVDRGHADGGVMILDAADADKITSSMKQTSNSLFKFQSFMSYQMELGYDLAIAPSSNVSGSFGFESFVGLFGSK